MTITEILPEIKKNVSLENHATFRIGGKAKYFFVAKSKEDLIKAVKTAKKFKLPFFVLGGGSNILISDKVFKGMVIKNEARKFKIKGKKIIAESGVILNRVVESAVKAGLAGLEEGSGIPGTLGGAVYGNSGWPKGKWAIGDFVEKAEILLSDGKVKKVDKKWFNFEYRESKLKKLKNKPIILEVVLKLKKSNRRDLEKKRREIFKIRSKKIPSGFSAGSIFKNPLGHYAGQLIDQCGLKGKKIGRAKISEKHANFIINLGEAKSKDVLKLIKLAKQKVKNKFGIVLEEEIRIINT